MLLSQLYVIGEEKVCNKTAVGFSELPEEVQPNLSHPLPRLIQLSPNPPFGATTHKLVLSRIKSS
jgi:hypothetical protein